jgi:hypothetical protein
MPNGIGRYLSMAISDFPTFRSRSWMPSVVADVLRVATMAALCDGFVRLYRPCEPDRDSSKIRRPRGAMRHSISRFVPVASP